MLVSIIIPTYNRGHTISATIQSILEQSYKNWELIIVDDGSQDNTPDIVTEISHMDNRVKYIRNNKNQGANACRNEGASHARGEFLVFFDSDNIMLPEYLEMHLEALEGSENTFCYCYARIIDGININVFPQKIYNHEELVKIIKYKNVIDMNSVMIKKQCFVNCGGFNPDMPRLQDWELFLNLLVRRGEPSVGIPEVLCESYIQDDSISKQEDKLIRAKFILLEEYKDIFNTPEIIADQIRSCIINSYDNIEFIVNKLTELYEAKDIFKAVLINIIMDLQLKQRYYRMLYKWKSSEQKDGDVWSLYAGKKIAIYGLGMWGTLLYRDMIKNNCQIIYGIDKKVEVFEDIDVRKPDDNFRDSDYIIVTIIQEFDAIKKTLKENYSGEIISLEHLFD